MHGQISAGNSGSLTQHFVPRGLPAPPFDPRGRFGPRLPSDIRPWERPAIAHPRTHLHHAPWVCVCCFRSLSLSFSLSFVPTDVSICSLALVWCGFFILLVSRHLVHHPTHPTHPSLIFFPSFVSFFLGTFFSDLILIFFVVISKP